MKYPPGPLPLDSPRSRKDGNNNSSRTDPNSRSDIASVQRSENSSSQGSKVDLALATIGASRLLRRSAIVGAAATLLGGAGALPLTGSACCRRGLLVVNAWLWGGSALMGLVCICWLPLEGGGPGEYESVPRVPKNTTQSTAAPPASRGAVELSRPGPKKMGLLVMPRQISREIDHNEGSNKLVSPMMSPREIDGDSSANPSTPRGEDTLGPLPGSTWGNRYRKQMPRAIIGMSPRKGRSSTPSEASYDTSSTLTLGAPLGRTLNTMELALKQAEQQHKDALALERAGGMETPNLPDYRYRRFNFFQVPLKGCNSSPVCYMVSCVGAIVVVCIASTVFAAFWKTVSVRSPANRLTGSQSFSPVLPVNGSTTSRSPRDQTLVACTGLSCEWALRVIKWKVHEWGSCTNRCGSGVMRRQVECRSGTVAYCRLRGQEPARWKECQQYDGCFWEVGNWSLCSNACGSGTQHREVRCSSKRIRDDCLYNEGEPESRRPCEETLGCSWDLGSWGACSSHCGSGEQRRALHCKGNPGITSATSSTTASSSSSLPRLRSTTVSSGSVSPWMDYSGSDKAAESYPYEAGRRLTKGCESLPNDVVTRWTVRSCEGISDCRWRVHDWGSCSGTCSSATRTRNITCANGTMAECRRRGEAPERTSHCTPAGCNAGAFWFGCACALSGTSDTVLAMAGALNALSGWTTASASWLIMVSRLPRASCTGNPKAVALLPLGSILFAGLSALVVSTVLGCSPAGCVSHARGIVVESGQFTVGLQGLAVWLAMLPGSKAQMESSISCIVLWACAGFMFLGLVAMTLHSNMGTLLVVGAEQLYRFCLAKLMPLLFAVLLVFLLVSALGCAYTNLGLKTRRSSLEDRVYRVLDNL